MKKWTDRIWEYVQRFSNSSNRGRQRARSRATTARRRIFMENLEGREMMAVTYHGGALLANVETQAVFLGSDWSSNATLASQKQDLDTFLSYVVDSPYMDMLTQAGYNVGRGSSSTGVVGQDVSKATGVTDSQIHSDLQALITSGQLEAPDANRLYVVYVEPGVAVKLGRSSSTNSFLGYHGAFAGKDTSGHSADIRYAVMPYPGSPNPTSRSQGFSGAFDELTAVTTHELAEAVTDPDVNYKRIGWYDDRLNGEIGDLTSRTSTLNGYLVQAVVDQSDRTIFPTEVVAPVTSPTNVTATALSATSGQITWTGVSGASGYHIYQNDGGKLTLLGNAGASATKYTLTGLAPNSTTSIVVEAFNASSTAAADPVSLITPALPPLVAPQNVTADATSATTAKISWTTVEGATGYKIYRTDGAQPVLLTTLGPNVSSYNVTGLTPESTVSFVVEAFNEAETQAADPVSVTLPAAPVSNLTAPEVTARVLSSNRVALLWNSVPTAEGYRIYYQNGTELLLLGTVGAQSTGVQIVGLTPGVEAQFVVQAFNGTDAADSALISVTTPFPRRHGGRYWGW